MHASQREILMRHFLSTIQISYIFISLFIIIAEGAGMCSLCEFVKVLLLHASQSIARFNIEGNTNNHAIMEDCLSVKYRPSSSPPPAFRIYTKADVHRIFFFYICESSIAPSSGPE